ncbi:SctD/MshK family protein [Aeromonas hydrophila]|uniref:SctD/MshK family protein n=1 Tax=Aeromonas hydrophila TaxID=644 RepID=UPI00191D398F|nr:MSHA biogenesis protein MshK [Aeromonas hydrophila]MBL0563666.1 MSHA biogenesis protein MshK [Aeromonas hydrophila]
MARWFPLWACLFSLLAQAQPERLQDPTAPLADVAVGARTTEESSATLPKLQSVVLGNGPTLAVLNGKVYRVGQQVDGYTLVAITADTVVLEKAGKRHAVTVFASKVRV